MIPSIRHRARLDRVAGAVLAVAGLTACGAGTPTEPLDAHESVATTPDLASPANRFEQVARFGSGRAMAVAATESVTVIATTIAVEVVRDGLVDEVPTLLPAPVADVVVAGDGRTVLLTAQSGAAELWTLETPRLLRSFGSVSSARFSGDGGHVDIVDDDAVTRVLTTDGSIAQRSVRVSPEPLTTTAWFGPERRALLIGASGATEVWDGLTVTDGAIDPTTAAATRRAVGDPSSDRVVLGLAGDGRFAGSIASVDVETGVEQWRHDIGADAVGPNWDVGSDGRILAVADMDAQLIGPDGEIDAAWTLDGVESVVSVIALDGAGGYAIVRARGSIQFVDAERAMIADGDSARRRLLDTTATASTAGVVAADVDGRVLRWDANGALVDDITSFVAGRINDVAVSSDGTTAAAAASSRCRNGSSTPRATSTRWRSCATVRRSCPG